MAWRKVWLLAAFLATSSALLPGPGGQLPPTTAAEAITYPCECFADGGPLLLDYDAVTKLILNAQKTIYSRGQNPNKHDQCKFQSRVVTFDDYPSMEGQVYIAWGAFSFGVHPNPKKYERCVQIYQDKVLLKGWGIGDSIELTDADLPWGYETQQGVIANLTLNAADNVLTLTSPDCPWKYEFTRGGFDSKVYLGVGDRFKPSNNGGKEMGGICHDCDGIPEFEECGAGGGKRAVSLRNIYRPSEDDRIKICEVNKYVRISKSCKSGKHQGSKQTQQKPSFV